MAGLSTSGCMEAASLLHRLDMAPAVVVVGRLAGDKVAGHKAAVVAAVVDTVVVAAVVDTVEEDTAVAVGIEFVRTPGVQQLALNINQYNSVSNSFTENLNPF